VHKVGSELNDARVIRSACSCAGQLRRQYFANRYRLLTDHFIFLADLEKEIRPAGSGAATVDSGLLVQRLERQSPRQIFDDQLSAASNGWF
jgi:hypothetical protein